MLRVHSSPSKRVCKSNFLTATLQSVWQSSGVGAWGIKTVVQNRFSRERYRNGGTVSKTLVGKCLTAHTTFILLPRKRPHMNSPPFFTAYRPALSARHIQTGGKRYTLLPTLLHRHGSHLENYAPHTGLRTTTTDSTKRSCPSALRTTLCTVCRTSTTVLLACPKPDDIELRAATNLTRNATNTKVVFAWVRFYGVQRGKASPWSQSDASRSSVAIILRQSVE